MTSRTVRKRTRIIQRDALRLARDAQRFADLVQYEGPYSEDAERLLKQVIRIALCAARLDTLMEEE